MSMITTERLWALFSVASGMLAACTPARNPVLELPPTPETLYFVGRGVSEDGRPIPVVVDLTRLGTSGTLDSSLAERLQTRDGQFRFEGLMPGRYVLRSRALGFAQRRDTFALSSPPGLTVTIPLRAKAVCLDMCGPDTAVVQAALAQRHRWQCDRVIESVHKAQARWGEFLADSLVRKRFGHSGDSATIAGQLRRIRSDRVCRRLAATLANPTTLAFTAFQWGTYWLISDPDFRLAVVLDEDLRPVAGMDGGGFLTWISDVPPSPGDSPLARVERSR
jgi:hypothetical protein